MADEQSKPVEQETEQKAAPSAEMKNTDSSQPEQTVPYHRFKAINDELKDLKDEAAKKAQAQQAEDEKKLAEQAEWQKLADSRKAKVDELTPRAELADKLTEMVAAQFEAEIKDWPKEVKDMAPAEDASILTKLEWMNKAKPLALAMMEDKTPTPGNGRKPAPVGAAATAKATGDQLKTWERKAIQRYR